MIDFFSLVIIVFIIIKFVDFVEGVTNLAIIWYNDYNNFDFIFGVNNILV